MSCGGDFPLGPGDPCPKCRKVASAGSNVEKEAVLVSGIGCTKLVAARVIHSLRCSSADITGHAPVSKLWLLLSVHERKSVRLLYKEAKTSYVCNPG